MKPMGVGLNLAPLVDSPCIKQTVCKVLKIFHHGKYLVAYVLKSSSEPDKMTIFFTLINIVSQNIHLLASIFFRKNKRGP